MTNQERGKGLNVWHAWDRRQIDTISV